MVKKVVDFAVERDLYLHAHCDEAALLILLGHNPKAKIIWAHTGFSTAPARVASCWTISCAHGASSPIAAASRRAAASLRPNGASCLPRHSDRFLLGSDTWINERWYAYDTIMKEYRGWLAQLPAEQAQRIAHGNAERLFGPRRGE